MNKFILSAIIISLSFSLYGCGSKPIIEKPNDQNQNKNKNLGGSQPLSEKMTIENLTFEIKINKQEFSLDDEIIVATKVTNVGTETIEYQSGSSSCPSHLHIRILSQENERHLEIKPSEEVMACTGDVKIDELDPDETVGAEVVFITKERINSSLEPAYGGNYDVIVYFLTHDGTWENTWEDAITARTTIHINGSETDIISAEEAEQIAIEQESLKEWMDQHSGDNIAKIVDGDYFILWYDGWQKTTKEQYDLMKNGIYQEEKSVTYNNGEWRIHYVSKLGPAPAQIIVMVDAKSKEVLSVNTQDR